MTYGKTTVEKHSKKSMNILSHTRTLTIMIDVANIVGLFLPPFSFWGVGTTGQRK
jgi:hypothetical protein